MRKVKHKYDVKMLNFNVTNKCFEYDKYKSKRHIHNIELSIIHYYFILFQMSSLTNESRGSSWDETHSTMLFFLSSDSTPQKIKLSKVLKIIFRLDLRPLQQEKVEDIVEN